MNSLQLSRSIQSVGKTCFVKYYHDFANSNISREDLIELLMKNEGYEESGSVTRVSQARRIIREGKAEQVIQEISGSTRIPKETVLIAKELLKTMSQCCHDEIESESMSVEDMWAEYNFYANKIASKLGRTNNIVGEYAEYLAHKYYGGRLLDISESSADIETDNGSRVQVKSRKLQNTKSTQLSVIRSWEFNLLVVVLFNKNGSIVKALEVPVEVAKEYAVGNAHQNGSVITTTRNFMNDRRSKDITKLFS